MSPLPTAGVPEGRASRTAPTRRHCTGTRSRRRAAGQRGGSAQEKESGGGLAAAAGDGARGGVGIYSAAPYRWDLRWPRRDLQMRSRRCRSPPDRVPVVRHDAADPSCSQTQSHLGHLAVECGSCPAVPPHRPPPPCLPAVVGGSPACPCGIPRTTVTEGTPTGSPWPGMY